MPIAHTMSSDAEMRKGFANTICKRIPVLKDYCKSRNFVTGDIITFRADKRLVYNVVTKDNPYEKPTTDTSKATLLVMRDHALGLNFSLYRNAKNNVWFRRNGLERDTFSN